MDIDQLVDSFHSISTKSPDEEWQNLLRSIELFEDIIRGNISLEQDINIILKEHHNLIKKYKAAFIDEKIIYDYIYGRKIVDESNKFFKMYELYQSKMYKDLYLAREIIRCGLLLFYYIHDSIDNENCDYEPKLSSCEFEDSFSKLSLNGF